MDLARVENALPPCRGLVLCDTPPARWSVFHARFPRYASHSFIQSRTGTLRMVSGITTVCARYRVRKVPPGSHAGSGLGPAVHVSYPGSRRGAKPGNIITYGLNGSQPGPVTAGPDGNLWFGEYNAQSDTPDIGKITTTGTVTIYSIPGTGDGPGGTRPAPRGTSGSPKSARAAT